MSFDTFDEGVAAGGIRSKHDIRTLICYMFVKVDRPMTKELVLNVFMQKGLANYFEASSSFDDLVHANHLIPHEGSSEEYTYGENAKLIADALEDTIAPSVREKAVECSLILLEKTRIEKENTVNIHQTEKGYDVVCRISGGDLDLLSFTIYAPDKQQAQLIRKNFYNDPEMMYELFISLLTNNNSSLKNILNKFK